MSLTSCGHESTRGTTLLRSTGTISGPWVEVGAVQVMPELGTTHTIAACTDPYGAGAAGYVTNYKTGEIDMGEASFTVNWISADATHTSLQADVLATTENFFRLLLSDVAATTKDFPALVTGVTEPVPGDGESHQLVVTMKVNGAVVRA